MNISGIDLNLLLAFEALMDERNVGRAAKRVGLSQPAFSNAIARLRARIGDSLFVRTAQGMIPTSRAERACRSDTVCSRPASADLRRALFL